MPASANDRKTSAGTVERESRGLRAASQSPLRRSVSPGELAGTQDKQNATPQIHYRDFQNKRRSMLMSHHAADVSHRVSRCWSESAVAAIAADPRTTTVEWPSENRNPTATGACPPASASGHIVDRRDVIGIHGMPKTKAVGKKGSAHQSG